MLTSDVTLHSNVRPGVVALRGLHPGFLASGAVIGL